MHLEVSIDLQSVDDTSILWVDEEGSSLIGVVVAILQDVLLLLLHVFFDELA